MKERSFPDPSTFLASAPRKVIRWGKVFQFLMLCLLIVSTCIFLVFSLKKEENCPAHCNVSCSLLTPDAQKDCNNCPSNVACNNMS